MYIDIFYRKPCERLEGKKLFRNFVAVINEA
jgi:hypothetical protein